MKNSIFLCSHSEDNLLKELNKEIKENPVNEELIQEQINKITKAQEENSELIKKSTKEKIEEPKNEIVEEKGINNNEVCNPRGGQNLEMKNMNNYNTNFASTSPMSPQ